MPEFTLRAAPAHAAPGFQRAADRSRARSAAFRQSFLAPARHDGEFPPDAIPAPEMSLSALSDLRPLGQIHESFIIAAGRDGLWIIDQHVAHERILFEQVLKQRAAGRVEMQQLLMPMILQLTPEQQIDYARIAEELHASGFETEPFGNRTIAVKAAPANVGPQDLERIRLKFWRLPRTKCALRHWTICGATSAPRSPAAPLSRSTCGWILRKWSGCCVRSPPRIAR
jgi:DNA mismatch repair ATPase MutL